MPKKRPLEPIAVKPNEPLRRCYDCIYWTPNSGEDFSTGSCAHNGYTKCPPLFCCRAYWHNENVTFLHIITSSPPS